MPNQQKPPQNQWTLKDHINAAHWVFHLMSLSVLVFLRGNLGFRFLHPLHLIGTAVAMLVIAGSVQNPGDRPGDLVVFAIAMLVAGFVQKFKRWRQIGKGTPVSSVYIGSSPFEFSWLPFMLENRRAARFLDSAFCFITGLFVVQFSRTLGLWLMVAALCLRLFEYKTWRDWLYANLDTVDSSIYSERLGNTFDRVTQPEPARQAADIPTGLSGDIAGKINQRKPNPGK